MKRSFSQFLAAVLFVFAVSFSSCTKESSKSSGPESVEATEVSSSSKSSSSSEAREYTLQGVDVELNDVGRRNLIESGYSRIRQNAEGTYVTGGNDPVGPYDPILCDGMTLSQVHADVNQKWSDFKNSPQGQNAQNYANSICKPLYFCFCNCAVCVIYIMYPTRQCYDYAAEIQNTSRVKAQLVIGETP